MSISKQYKAPAGDRSLLIDPAFDKVPSLIASNRRHLDHNDVRIGKYSLRELRSLARLETFPNNPDSPLIITGHQPELFHPGVWVKNFAAHALARRLGCESLNLIVDNDTIKSASLKVPVYAAEPRTVRIDAVPFDRFPAEEPYETRRIHDVKLFHGYMESASLIFKNWGFEPLIRKVWPSIAASRFETLGEKFTEARTRLEREWGGGTPEIPVSKLAKLQSFAIFAEHIGRSAEFHRLYNDTVRQYRKENKIRSRNHPVPDLDSDETPFWIMRTSRRDPARIEDLRPGSPIRPRALTLTLFARLILGDFFIHGIGGGIYDLLTDRIISGCFGIEPPAYQVLSATLFLPFPRFPHCRNEVRELERLERDLKWNPQRHLSDEAKVQDVESLIRDHPKNHEGRLQRFRDLRAAKEKLLAYVETQKESVHGKRDIARREANANDVLTRRDYSWVWYPEERLREFMNSVMKQAGGIG